MFHNFYTNHDYFSGTSFATIREALRDARRTGFDTAIYSSTEANPYKDTNKVLVATYSVISGVKVIDAASKTACLYQGEAYCVNSSDNHIC